MCDQTTAVYNHGDIVWVKLHSCWWPGEVIGFDNLPTDIKTSFKKPPLAAVKFFEEDNFEFVKSLNHIFTYNCSKKYDFIKKGLDMHRNKHSFMEKFPTDVCAAENKTGGNPNILNDPKLTPQKKTNYANIFGTPNTKKSVKESPKSAGRKSTGKIQPATSAKKVSSSTSMITHPRFIGRDDHVVRELIQSSTKQPQPKTEYKCQNCSFTCTRVDVIVLHNKSHIQGVYTTGPTRKPKRSPVKRQKPGSQMSRTKTNTIDEDIALLMKGIPICTDESSDEATETTELTATPKRKQKTSSVTKTKKAKIISKSPEPEPKPKDIRTDLLAEWDDDDEDEELEVKTVETPEKSEDVPEKPKPEKDNSCFDFNEEDDDMGMSIEGRKIPRVIPPTEKRTSVEFSAKPKEFEDKKSKYKSALSEKATQDEKKNDPMKEPDIENFQSILEETKVPKLPEIPQILKCEQNFHNAKTIKFPDKTEPLPEPKDSPIATKLTNPKKRFVKTFEDETKNSTKESEEKTPPLEELQQIEEKIPAMEEPQEKILPIKEPIEEKPVEVKSSVEEEIDEEMRIPVTIIEVIPRSIEVTEIPSIEITEEKMEKKKRGRKPSTGINLEVSKLKSQLMMKLTELPKVKEKSKKEVRKKRTCVRELDEDEGDVIKPAGQIHEKKRRKTSESQDKNLKEKYKIETTKADDSSSTDVTSNESDFAGAELTENEKIAIQDIIGVTNIEDAPIEEKFPESPKGLPKEADDKVSIIPEADIVDIDGNLTVVSEKELADKQVEIATIPEIQKPITLTSFSMDFSEELPIPETKKNDFFADMDVYKNYSTPEKSPKKRESPKKVSSSTRITEFSKKIDSPKILVKIESPKTPVKIESPKTPVQIESPKAPVKIESPKTPVKIECPKTPVKIERPKTPVKIESPKVPVKIESPKTPVKIESPNSPVKIESPKVPVKIESPKTPVKIESPKTPVKIECPKAPVEIECTKNAVKIESPKRVDTPKKTETPKNPMEADILQKFETSDNSTGAKESDDYIEEKIEAEDEGPHQAAEDLKHEDDIPQFEVMTNHLDFVRPVDSKMEIEEKTDDPKLEESVEKIDDPKLDEIEEKIVDLKLEEIEKINDPKVEEIEKIDDPKMEEIEKIDDPKMEEIEKINDPKMEQIVDSKVEIDKIEDPKVEKIDKFEDNKVEKIEKVDNPKVEEIEKIDDPKVEIQNIEDPKVEIEKIDDPKVELEIEINSKIEEEKTDETNKMELEETKVELEQVEDSKIEIETIEHTNIVSEKLDDFVKQPTENDKLEELEVPQEETIEEQIATFEETPDVIKEETPDVIKEVIQAESDVIEPPLEPLTDAKVNPSLLTTPTEADIPDDKMTDATEVKEEIQAPSVESEVAKITDSICEPVVIPQQNHPTTSTKLLEILTDKPKQQKPLPKLETSPRDKKTPRTSKPTCQSPKVKTVVLPEKPIKPETEIQVKKVSAKRSFNDIEDIDTFIIQKPVKKLATEKLEETVSKPVIKPFTKGKARILQQTIITPSGDIIQPAVTQSQEDLYDINSMPIMLGDQLLTDSIEAAPPVIVKQEPLKQINPIKKLPPQTQSPQMKILNKGVAMKETTTKLTAVAAKAYLGGKQKIQKVYQTSSSTKLLKNNPSIITQPGKPGKFIIVPSSSTPPTGSKYTVGKRPTIVKKTPQKIPISSVPTKVVTSEPTGNKIMILTDSQGQQQKVLLTPAQQKQLIGQKKRPIFQKQIVTKDMHSRGANIISQTIVSSKGQVTTLGNAMPTQKNIKIDHQKPTKRLLQRITPEPLIKPGPSGQQRTIIIKNQQGQTVKKIQGTDDTLLEQQVAEQVQAINRAAKSQMKEALRPPLRTPSKKSYTKKDVRVPVKQQMVQNVPPLAPISPNKKPEPVVEAKPEEQADDSKPKFVIRDGNGALINISEGQILALPSEAIDGQPQSYVLVTVDESGNLTPLNSEALMSLDPNLNLGGDLSNTLLQIDQGGAQQEGEVQLQIVQDAPAAETVAPMASIIEKEVEKSIEPPQEACIPATTPEQNVQAVVNAGDMGQLIITGDPVSAQKFLDSLAEGNTDLANLLANTDGNVLIQTDGQQILINTDAENSMMLVNQENIESNEGSGNPVFAVQSSSKSQDILAAALAGTDVFQQDQAIGSKGVSQLSPNSGLFPIVGNVLETSTMSSPIMTPLEIPSTNTKKIDEADILTQGQKNDVLPITITDPSISQTASQHQVASLMAGDLQDLPLAIQDPAMLVTSSGMNSPSFVYSLPTLDDSDISQKAFSGSISMPLLTEEPEEIQTSEIVETSKDPLEKILDTTPEIPKESEPSKTKTEEYMMRSEICNSLSEPPPDMFEFTIDSQQQTTPEIDSTPSSVLSNVINDQESIDSSIEDTLKLEDTKSSDVPLFAVNTSSPSTEDSCEIPVQPPIIASLAKTFEENGTSDEQSFSTDGDN